MQYHALLLQPQVEHSDPGLADLILRQKWPAVRDMVRLLGLGPERFEPGGWRQRDMQREAHVL